MQAQAKQSRIEVIQNEEAKPAAAPAPAAPAAEPAPAPAAPEPAPAVPVKHAADPADVQLLDQHGRPMGSPAQEGVVIAHASTALAAAAVDHLTTYVQGLPMGDLEALAEFMSPRVDAGLSYEYEIEPDANQLGIVAEDEVGYNGLPAVIQLDPRTKGTGTLKFRGLELPYNHTDQQLDLTVPGRGGIAAGEQRRSRRCNAFVERGRLSRLIALAAANTSASNIDFSADSDPIVAMQTIVLTLAETCACPPSWVRILLGSTAWKYIIQHPYLIGGATWARAAITKSRICELLELPQENLMVSYIQALTSKQGKTAAKSTILGGTTIYFFVQPPASQPEDPGWAKTFAMPLKGGFKYVYRNTTHQALNVFNVGVAYYEDMKCVSSSAILQRTAVTT